MEIKMEYQLWIFAKEVQTTSQEGMILIKGEPKWIMVGFYPDADSARFDSDRERPGLILEDYKIVPVMML